MYCHSKLFPFVFIPSELTHYNKAMGDINNIFKSNLVQKHTRMEVARLILVIDVTPGNSGNRQEKY